MTKRTQNPSIPPWLVAAGVGVALVGVWALGREWGASLADSESEEEGNPNGMDVGRQQNPAEAAWMEARPFVVPYMASIERIPMPHECNPLNPATWGEGRICVAAGSVFISVSPSSQHHVKKPFVTEVQFSENLQHCLVGDGWHRGVLGRWLAGRPQLEPHHNTLLALQSAGWPMSIGAMFVRAPYGVELLREFAETHYIKTPVGTIRIVDLPATPATNAFREEIAAQIAEAVL